MELSLRRCKWFAALVLSASFWTSAFAQSDAAQNVLFLDDFQDGNAKGWSFSGEGKNRVTNYEGNRSLNLTRTRSAEVSVSVAGYDGFYIQMQLAAIGLGRGETCQAEVSTDGGSQWQTLLKVVASMADGVTLHSNTGAINRDLGTTPLMLRLRADGGRSASCWGDNVKVWTDQPVQLD